MTSRTTLLVVAVLSLHASAAFGDEAPAAPERNENSLPASSGLEIAIAVGHGQAYGKLGRDLPTLNDLGGLLDLAVGWHLDRRWMVGAYGSIAAYSSLGNRNASYAGAAGLQLIHHFPGASEPVPWLGLGFGWRGYWASPDGPRTSYQGFDLARLQAGIDSALSPSITVSPVLGASLATFVWQSGGLGGGSIDASDRRLSVSVLAGLLVRFDVLRQASDGGR